MFDNRKQTYLRTHTIKVNNLWTPVKCMLSYSDSLPDGMKLQYVSSDFSPVTFSLNVNPY